MISRSQSRASELFFGVTILRNMREIPHIWVHFGTSHLNLVVKSIANCSSRSPDSGHVLDFPYFLLGPIQKFTNSYCQWPPTQHALRSTWTLKLVRREEISYYVHPALLQYQCTSNNHLLSSVH